MRRAHWLPPNPRTVIPTHHICVATACRPAPDGIDQCELVQAGLTHIEWVRGSAGLWPTDLRATWRETWDWIMSRCSAKSVTWIWLLDQAQDLQALQFARLVESGEWDRDWWCWGEPPTILAGRLRGRPVRIVGIDGWLDPRSEAVATVWPLGGTVGGMGEWSGDEWHDRARWDSRLCASLVQEVLRFVRREDLGHLCSTVGGQSLQTYRHLHLPGNVLCHANARALALERDAAIGQPIAAPCLGAVQGPIYVVDVNGLYPYVMGRYPYPRKLMHCTGCDSMDAVRRLGETHLLIARVSGHDPVRDYLVQRDRRCRWTNDLCADVLVGPDLDSALSRGVVEVIHEVAAYDPAGLFVRWAEWAWDLRQRYRAAGDRIGHVLAKQLGIALWGKFGGRTERWEPAPHAPDPPSPYGAYLWTDTEGVTHQCRAIAGQVDILRCHEEPEHSVASISAFVAAYARAYVDGIAAVAERVNVVYRCADALHVTEAGWQRLNAAGLVDVTRFGALKLVRRVESAYYHAPNIYQHDGLWSWAGRAMHARPVEGDVWEWESTAPLAQSILEPPTGLVGRTRHRVSLRQPSPLMWD